MSKTPPIETPLIDKINLDKAFGGYTAPAKLSSIGNVNYTDVNLPPVIQPSTFHREPGRAATLQDLENFLTTPTHGDGRMTGGSISRSLEESFNPRFPNFVPGGFDNEDAYGQGQSTLSKITNGVGKGLVLTGTTFLQTTAGMINGIAAWADTGRAASFYDNEFNHALDEINKKSEDILPNYYTNLERSTHWYSPSKLVSANFIWDGIVKNLGFAAGAAASGGVFSAGIRGITALGVKALPNTAKLFSTGKAAEALAATEKALFGSGGVGKSAEMLGNLTKLSNKYLSQYNVLNKGQRYVVAGLATTGEAGIEAMHGLNEWRDEAIQNYVDEYGYEPTGKDLEEINEYADKVGNGMFALNTALLTATNYIMFPKILGSSYKAEKSLVAGLRKDVREIVKIDGKFSVKEARKGVRGVLEKIGKPMSYTFSRTEAFEEGGQYAIGIGTKDYYDKMRAGDPHNIFKSAIVGAHETVTTDEGMENILIGGISGALMLGRGKWNKAVQKDINTGKAVTALNKHAMSGFSKATLNSVIRGANIQEERAKLIKQGNEEGVEGAEADFIINYLTPRIKYGRMDLVNEDIATYTQLASTEEGWAQLISEGKAEPTDTRSAFLSRLQNLSETAQSMESLYQSLSIRYGNMTAKDGTKLFPEEVLEKMMYAGSKIDDYNKRMARTMPFAGGVDIQAVIDGVVTGKSRETVAKLEEIDANEDLTAEEKVTQKAEIMEATKGADVELEKALAEIDATDTSTLKPEQKETAKLAVTRIATMALYRDMFTKEYQDMKNRPEEYREASLVSDGSPAVDENGDPITAEAFTVQTRTGNIKVVPGKDYYLGRVVEYDEKGKEVYRAPRLTIIGENEDGTIKIRTNTGAIRDIAKEELLSYNLGDVDKVAKRIKAKFYMDNWNKVYTYNFGKKWGGKKTGRLEYNPTNDTMLFVYSNKKGGRSSKEVTGQDFVPNAKRGFKVAKMEQVGELVAMTAEQKATAEAFKNSRDPRTAEKIERRLSLLGHLLADTLDRQESITKLVKAKKKAIAKAKYDLRVLDETNFAKRKGRGVPKFKTQMRTAQEQASRLITLQNRLQRELEELAIEQEEVALTRTYTAELIDNIEDLPDSTKEFKDLLEDELLNLEVAHETTSKQMAIIGDLIKITKDGLEAIINVVTDLISKFESAYPNVPRVMGQDWVDFLKTNPNFLKLKPKYKEDLELIEDGIADIEEEHIIPSQVKLGKLNEQYDALAKSLEEMEVQIRAKQNVLDHLQGAYDTWEVAKMEEAAFAENGKAQEQLVDLMDTDGQLNTDGLDKFEADNKKAKEEVVTSGKSPTPGVSTKVGKYVERMQRFAARFYDLPNHSDFKVAILNFNTAEKTVPGIYGAIINQKNVDPQDILLMAVTNSKGQLLDENGEVIEDRADYAEKGIFQTFPAVDKKGQLTAWYPGPDGKKVRKSMFRDTVPKEERRRLEKQYTTWKENQKALKEVGPLQSFKPSFGILQYVMYDGGRRDSKGNAIMERDFAARTSGQDAKFFTEDDLGDKDLIIIPSLNAVNHTEGSVTYKNPLGRLFLRTKGGMVKLFSKKLSLNQAESVFNAMNYISGHVQKRGEVQDGKVLDLFKWLKTMVYYGLPAKNGPGNNSVYFKRVDVGEDVWETRLFIGKQEAGGKGYAFTPENLKTNRVAIIADLLEMRQNVQKHIINTKNFDSYYEVTHVTPEGTMHSINKDGSLAAPNKWENYQTYLLSNKKHDGSPRKTEDIPLTTIARPVEGENDTNRTGIYFTLTTTPEEFKVAVKPEEDPNTEPEVGEPVTPPEAAPVEEQPKEVKENPGFKSKSGNWNYNGETINQVQFKDMPLIKFIVNGAAVVDAFVKLGAKSFKDILVEDQQEFFDLIDASNAFDFYVVDENGNKLTYTKQIELFTKLKDGNREEGKALDVALQQGILQVVLGDLITVVNEEAIAEEPDPNLKEVKKEVAPKEDTAVNEEREKIVNEWAEATIELEKLQGEREMSANEDGGSTYTPESQEEEDEWKEFGTPQEREKKELDEKYEKRLAEFDEADVEDAPKGPTEKENAASAKVKKGKRKNRRKRDNFRMKLIEQNKPFREERWEQIIPWFEKNFPNIPLYRVKNMIQASNGKQAWGMLKQGAIYVNEGALEGTAYHEVFEAVWKMMVDPKEKRAIIQEFRNRKGTYTDRFTGETVKYAMATNGQLKEEMAEEFKDYVLHGKSPSRSPKSLIKRIFKWIVEAYNKFFKNGEEARNNTKKLFDKIGNGFYRDYNQYAGPLSLANVGVQDIMDAAGDANTEYRMQVPVIQEHEVVQHMTSVIVNELFSTNKGLFELTNKLNQADLYNTIKTDIFGDAENAGIFEEKIYDYEDAMADNKMAPKDAQRKIASIEHLSKQVEDNWNELVEKHVQQMRAFQIEFDESEQALPENDNGKGDYMDSVQLDAYKKSSLAVKVLLATLPDIQENEDGTVETKISSIGGTTFMKADKVFITLMNTLHTSTNLNDMLARLRELAERNKEENYGAVYERITKRKISDIDANGIMNFDDMQEQDARLLIGFWKTMKKQNPDVLTVFLLDNGEVVIGNTDLASAAKESKYEMTNNIVNTVKDKDSKLFKKVDYVYTASDTLKKTTIDSSKISHYTAFLETLGISMDPEKIEDTLVDKHAHQLEVFKTAVSGILDSLQKVDGVATLNAKTMGIGGRLLELGVIQAILENKQFESTYFSLKGEKTQTFIGTNHISTFYDTFKEATETMNQLYSGPLKYLMTDSFAKGSVVLSKVFNLNTQLKKRKAKTGNIGSVVYADGTHSAIGDKRVQSSKLNFVQRLIQEINLNIDGVYMNLVPGDAEIEWGIRLHSKGSSFVSDEDITHKDYLNIFKEYFKAEVNLARDERIISQSATNYGSRDVYDLRFFKAILADPSLTGTTKDALHKKIVNVIKSPKNLSSEDIYEQFKTEIESAVERYITNETISTTGALRGLGIIQTTSSGFSAQKLNFEHKTASESVMHKQMKKLTLNYIIANIEMHKLFYSDPYQYSDELKRIKNFNSPRVALVHGSDELNMTLDKIYNKGFKKGDIGWTDMTRDHFRTITLGDVWSNGELADYKKPYEETDGGGVITMQGNRIFRIRTGDWTPNNEAQYRHDMKYQSIVEAMNDTNLTPKEIQNLTASLEKHEESNPGIKDTYKPLKPIASGNKKNRRSYNDIVLDKYALFPMSFRLLHKMNPETTMLKLNNKMVAEDVHYGVFESGRKVGTEKVYQVYNKDGSFNQSTPFQSPEEAADEATDTPNVNTLLGVTSIPFIAIGLQTEVPSKDNNLVTRGSQMTKLATLDFMSAGVPVDFMKGSDFIERFNEWIKLSEDKKKEVSPLYKEIQHNRAILEEQTEHAFEGLLSLLGISDINGTYVIEDRAKLVKNIESEVFKREVNDNLIEAFKAFTTEDVIIEATAAYQQVRNILYSIASKEVIKPKVSGGLKVQVSAAMLESVRAKATTVKTKSGSKQVYTSDILNFYSRTEDGKTVNVAEIMVGRWFKSHKTDDQLLDEWYVVKDGVRTSELTKEGRKILEGVGFRTPTQKQNSIDAFVIKRFLPAEYGDSIILPSGIVKKAGSDFDIDKFSVYLKNLFKDTKGNLVPVPFHGFGRKAKDKFRKQYRAETAKHLDIKLSQLSTNNLHAQRLIKLVNKTATPEEALAWGPKLAAIVSENIVLETASFEEVLNWFASRKKTIEATIDKLDDAELQGLLEENSVRKMYKQSLENEYLDSTYKLISHPENFERLVKPNSADQLKELTRKINKKLGRDEIDYSSTGFMLNRMRMSYLRQAFVTGKQAIGIAAVAQTNHGQNQRTPIFIDKTLIKDLDIPQNEKFWLGDGTIRFDEYNSIDINGERVPTLSMAENKAGETISDTIGMFIDGYVDISKGPWIMEMGATPVTAGTWLTLIKLGVPVETVAYFMNQPIILEHLKTLQQAGIKTVYNERIAELSLDAFGLSLEDGMTSQDSLPTQAQLAAMVGNDNLKAKQNQQQALILTEFLKYAMLSEQLRQITEGSNYDTAFLNDPFLVYQKKEQYNRAKKTVYSGIEVNNKGEVSKISGVDAILDNSFVGNLAYIIGEWRDAAATTLISDQGKTRDLMESILAPYVNLNAREFVKVAQRAVESMFDWATQLDEREGKSNFSKTIDKVFLGDDSNVKKIMEFKEAVLEDPSHPLHDNMVIEAMLLVPGDTADEIDTIRLMGRDNKVVYDQNQLIHSFQEIKDYLKDDVGQFENIYPMLVRVAIMQSGLTSSPISFSKLLPYEDFKEQYNRTLSTLGAISNMEDFAEIKAFQRNNWHYPSTVPTIERDLRVSTDLHSGRDVYYNPAVTQNEQNLTDAHRAGEIPQTLYFPVGSPGTASDVITYRYADKLEYAADIPEDEVKRRKAKGDTHHITKMLMQKVYHVVNGESVPFLHITVGDNGKVYMGHIYKHINAWGDSIRAQEYHNYIPVQQSDGTIEMVAPRSKINNGYSPVKVTLDKSGKQLTSHERSDEKIIEAYKGGNVVSPLLPAGGKKAAAPATQSIAPSVGEVTVDRKTGTFKVENKTFPMSFGVKELVEKGFTRNQADEIVSKICKL